MVAIQNERADIRPAYLQDTKVSVCLSVFVLSVKINALLAACQNLDSSVGIVNCVRAGYPRNRCSIPDRGNRNIFYPHRPYWLCTEASLKSTIQTQLRNLLCFSERTSSGCVGRSSLHIRPVRLDGCLVSEHP